jgi:hypothetical protein
LWSRTEQHTNTNKVSKTKQCPKIQQIPNTYTKIQSKLTLALTLCALAAAIPAQYKHQVREHTLAGAEKLTAAAVDTGKATANAVIQPAAYAAVYAKDAVVDTTVNAKNAVVDTTVHAKNVVVDTTVSAKNTVVDGAIRAKDGAAHIAHEIEKTTAVQGAEASGRWFMKKVNSAIAGTTGAFSRVTGNIAASQQEAAQYHDESLNQNNVIEPAAEIKDNVTERAVKSRKMFRNEEAPHSLALNSPHMIH